jgi:hypothetical protein
MQWLRIMPTVMIPTLIVSKTAPNDVKYLAMSIAILHNYYLREQLSKGLLEWDRNSVQEFPYLPTIPNEPGQGPDIPIASELGVLEGRATKTKLVAEFVAILGCLLGLVSLFLASFADNFCFKSST